MVVEAGFMSSSVSGFWVSYMQDRVWEAALSRSIPLGRRIKDFQETLNLLHTALQTGLWLQCLQIDWISNWIKGGKSYSVSWYVVGCMSIHPICRVCPNTVTQPSNQLKQWGIHNVSINSWRECTMREVKRQSEVCHQSFCLWPQAVSSSTTGVHDSVPAIDIDGGFYFQVVQHPSILVNVTNNTF